MFLVLAPLHIELAIVGHLDPHLLFVHKPALLCALVHRYLPPGVQQGPLPSSPQVMRSAMHRGIAAAGLQIVLALIATSSAVRVARAVKHRVSVHALVVVALLAVTAHAVLRRVVHDVVPRAAHVVVAVVVAVDNLTL